MPSPYVGSAARNVLTESVAVCTCNLLHISFAIDQLISVKLVHVQICYNICIPSLDRHYTPCCASHQFLLRCLQSLYITLFHSTPQSLCE